MFLLKRLITFYIFWQAQDSEVQAKDATEATDRNFNVMMCFYNSDEQSEWISSPLVSVI